MTPARTDVAPMAADVDMRAFRYALAPLQQREQWRLQRLEAVRIRHQQAVLACQQEVTALKTAMQPYLIDMHRHLVSRVAPELHRQGLRFLDEMRGRLDHAERRHQSAQETHKAASKAVSNQQLKLKGIEEHRSSATADYALVERQRAAKEADMQWSAKSHASSDPMEEHYAQ